MGDEHHIDLRGAKFTWRAIVLNPTFPDWDSYSLRRKLRIVYGWDVFFYKVPVLKATVLLNALVTLGIVRVAS